jgi:uncharacterized membrane protein (UPF0127 family)
MLFMRFAIGVVFLDNKGCVLGKQLLEPWQISSKVKEAATVIEVAPKVLDWIENGEKLITIN